MRCLVRLLSGCLFVALLAAPARADEPAFDLVIRNGKIVDGTGNPWFFGDVAIRGDRIVAVGRVPGEPAKREIDAKGLVVAPGFIDMHSHSDYLLLEDGHAQSKIRQGVTTEVLGEGTSAGPYLGKLPARTATVSGKDVQMDHPRRLFRRPRTRRRLGQRRLLCRPRQRLAGGHGHVASSARRRRSSTR